MALITLAKEQAMSKTVLVGTTYFRTPFRATGFWVEDADRKSVTECRSTEIAKAIADMLNKTHG